MSRDRNVCVNRPAITLYAGAVRYTAALENVMIIETTREIRAYPSDSTHTGLRDDGFAILILTSEFTPRERH